MDKEIVFTSSYSSQLGALISLSKYLNNIDFKRTLVIDKSATFRCIDRFRYCKLRGAVTSVIPEELIVVNNDPSLIAAALHKFSLAQIDYLFGGGKIIEKYAFKNKVKVINCKNHRLNINEIEQITKTFKIDEIKYKNKFLLINDNTTTGYSS